MDSQKRSASRIPVLREICPNITKSSANESQSRLQKPSRLMGLFSRVGARGKVGGGAEKMKVNKGEGEIIEQLERYKKENETLRSRLSEYERLCFSLDQVFDHYPATLPGGGEDILVEMFVENVILKSKQTLLDERLQTLANSSSKYINQSAQTSDTTELVSSERLPHAIDAAVSTDPLNLTDSSTNTSLVHTADIAVGTTGIAMADIAVGTPGVEVADVSINTSFTLEEDQVDLRKRLEAAQITVELLQCSREDSQQKVISLETVIDSLRDELRGKDDRLATLSDELRGKDDRLDSLSDELRGKDDRLATLSDDLRGKDDRLDSLSDRLTEMVRKCESTESDLQYRQLYQQSVQHCEVLQRRAEKFQALFDKMERAKQLKEAVLALLAENKAFLDTRWQELSNQEQQWANKLKTSALKQEALTKECERLQSDCLSLVGERDALATSHARLLATQSITRAVQTLEREKLGASLISKESEIAKLKRRMSTLANALERSRHEQREAGEFSEAEREMLMETNSELEGQITTLKDNLQEKNRELSSKINTAEQHIQELLDERSQARDFLLSSSAEIGSLRSAMKEVCVILQGVVQSPPQSLTQDAVNEPSDVCLVGEAGSISLARHLHSLAMEVEKQMNSRQCDTSKESLSQSLDCLSCQRRQSELESALAALNGKSCARYGDLLRQNFSLQQEVQELTGELDRGDAEFKKLSSYISEYQARSTKKVDVLKESLRKTDKDISELDKLIDQVREVMHANIGHVKRCGPMLQLLRELDGNEAPKQY